MKIMPPSRHKQVLGEDRHHLMSTNSSCDSGETGFHHDRTAYAGEAHFLNTGMDIPFDPWDPSRPVASA